jgi:L-ectoine synthase
MIVRTLDDITGTDRDIETENWRSKRLVLAGDGVHQLRPRTQMRTVCVFNPPVTGREVHDENGVYPLIVLPAEEIEEAS